ncbi:MAG TPA: hypothetical protein VLA74_05315 [Nitrososphaeraceae archaeon]|nr:hypothetical protein [Nitrososphaeraceae archaeon]
MLVIIENSYSQTGSKETLKRWGVDINLPNNYQWIEVVKPEDGI